MEEEKGRKGLEKHSANPKRNRLGSLREVKTS